MQENRVKMSADDSNCRLTRRLVEEGGVTLQRFRWTPAPGNPYSGDQRLLALSLELLLEFYTPGRLEGLLSELWPGIARAFLIAGNTILAEPGFSDEIRDELIDLNKTSAVDMRLTCLRLAPEKSVDRSGQKQGDFDSIQICSGLVIGSRQVSLGIVYRDSDDRNAELSPRLRWMSRQIQQDQNALLPLIRSHRRQPNVARALVNSQSGELVWNNALARVGWPDKNRFIELLIKPELPAGYELSPGAAVDLTLITFLRSGRKTASSFTLVENSGSAEFQTQPKKAGAEGQIAADTKTENSATEFALPDPIKRRLKKVLFEAQRTNRIESYRASGPEQITPAVDDGSESSAVDKKEQ